MPTTLAPQEDCKQTVVILQILEVGSTNCPEELIDINNIFLQIFSRIKQKGYCKSSNKKVATVPEKIATPMNYMIISAKLRVT